MFPLTRQVQIGDRHGQGLHLATGRVEIPVYEDKEASSASSSRASKVHAYLEGFKPEQIDGTEEKTVVLKRRAAT